MAEWFPDWVKDESRQAVADSLRHLNGTAARWGLSTPQQYRAAEVDFLKAALDFSALVENFMLSCELPPEIEPPPLLVA